VAAVEDMVVVDMVVVDMVAAFMAAVAVSTAAAASMVGASTAEAFTAAVPMSGDFMAEDFMAAALMPFMPLRGRDVVRVTSKPTLKSTPVVPAMRAFLKAPSQAATAPQTVRFSAMPAP
jgi:hypothetical protein